MGDRPLRNRSSCPTAFRRGPSGNGVRVPGSILGAVGKVGCLTDKAAEAVNAKLVKKYAVFRRPFQHKPQ